MTRAYRPDGSTRFDALSELKALHPTELAELSWLSIYSRPDLQIRAFVIKNKDNYKALNMIPDFTERAAMMLTGYNGGMGGLQKERRVCGLVSGCNPQKWYGNVEKHCGKSKAKLYGNRSACDINRHYVPDIQKVRSPKYRAYYAHSPKHTNTF